MRKLLVLSVLTPLALAGSAGAAGGGTISLALHPDKVKRHSKLTVSASGFTETSLPTSAEIDVQKGFKASAKSVAALCATPSSCPAASKIGSGVAQVTATAFGVPIQDTVNFTLFLGRPERSGDIASVIVTGKDTKYGIAAAGSARLLNRAGGGLEVLFDHFPSISSVGGVAVTLNSFSLTAGATRTVSRHHRKVTYSLITNPAKCSGHWSGSASVTFSGSASSNSLFIPCSK
jgi:hypothetical protein